MVKVRPWCGQPLDRGRLGNRIEQNRHILLSDSANCTVLSAVVLTQYRRVTDGQTDRQADGIAIASTALAIPALRHAVKKIKGSTG